MYAARECGDSGACCKPAVSSPRRLRDYLHVLVVLPLQAGCGRHPMLRAIVLPG
jgi:hypothetical protein